MSKLHRIPIDDAGSFIDVMHSPSGTAIMRIVDYEKEGDEPAQETGSRFIYLDAGMREALIEALQDKEAM